MTKWIGTLVVVLLVAAAGCNEETRATAWVLSGQHTDLIARVGAENDNTEVGAVVKYVHRDEIKWGPEPDIAGAYLLFHLTQDVTIEDTLKPSPIGPVLEALHARPYAGLEVVGNTDSRARNAQPNWIAGTRFSLSPGSRVALVVEYTDGDQAAGDVFLGIRGRF